MREVFVDVWNIRGPAFRPSVDMLKIAPAFRPARMREVFADVWNIRGPAFRPSMGHAENCSCIFSIPSIHGHQKKMAPRLRRRRQLGSV
jgi:hypothetical protein